MITNVPSIHKITEGAAMSEQGDYPMATAEQSRKKAEYKEEEDEGDN